MTDYNSARADEAILRSRVLTDVGRLLDDLRPAIRREDRDRIFGTVGPFVAKLVVDYQERVARADERASNREAHAECASKGELRKIEAEVAALRVERDGLEHALRTIARGDRS